MIIIGITGTLGAGKGTVVEYLTQHKNFSHYSARKFLTLEAKRREMPLDRDTFHFIANDLRKTQGPYVIAESLYSMALESDKDAIIESLHTTGEISFLREKNHFFLLGVDANIETRYERISKRNSETDSVTLERFKSVQASEMENEDPKSQNLAACIKMADAVVMNDQGREELYAKVDKVLESFFKTEKVA